MEKLTLALVGFGTVGSGLLSLLSENRKEIARKTGIDLELKYVIDQDLSKLSSLKGVQISNDYRTALNDPEVSLVVELTGGVDFPLRLFNETAAAGKHFVTANKALLSRHLYAMFEAARKNRIYIGFEASVAGGIPIIHTLRRSLAGNRIQAIEGIINGTTNYILTQMEEQGIDFPVALKQAQDLGFAEADPTLDINGGDAASKIAILAAISFNQNVEYDDVYAEGIEKVSIIDIEYAKKLGYRIKLLGISSLNAENEVDVRVHPCLVGDSNPLAGIRNEFNAVAVESDFLGLSMYYGRGAGARPTASAVVSDVIDIASRTLKKKEYNESFFMLSSEKKLRGMEKTESRYYVRIMTQDQPGILARIAQVFGENGISIATVIQLDTEQDFIPLVLTTHQAAEKQFQDSLTQIREFGFVDHVVYYRILD